MSKHQTASPWSYKPWWCQPWSIVLTGFSLMGGSWWLFHKVWITVCVSIPVLTWMGFFLILWPRLILSQDGFALQKQHDEV